MLALLKSYSVGEILIFIVILALAIKEVISLYQYFAKGLSDSFNNKYKKQETLNALSEKIPENSPTETLFAQRQPSLKLVTFLPESIEIKIGETVFSLSVLLVTFTRIISACPLFGTVTVTL